MKADDPRDQDPASDPSNRLAEQETLAGSMGDPGGGAPGFDPGSVLGPYRLEQRGPLPAAEAVDRVLEIIEGLEAAAEIGSDALHAAHR